MAFDLPLPRVVADVEKGGPYVTAARGINQLRNEQLEKEINRVKALYAPLTTRADAESKMAYARLLGPQYLAKLAANPAAMANLTEDEKRDLLQYSKNAGMGASGTANSGMNALNNIPNVNQGGSNSLIGLAYDYLMNKIMPQNNTQQSAPTNAFTQSNQQQVSTNPLAPQGSGRMMPEHPEQEKLLQQAEGNGQKINEPTPISKPRSATYSENAGREAGIQKEGEVLGTERGKDISNLGKEQLALSTSGHILDRLVHITQNPTFKNMRAEIPFFQDKQLNVLSKIGTKEEQKLIGDFISTAQAFKASTVNSFKGKALEKEFGLADKIKIDENDTMAVAEGKLSSLKTLKDIAETKNDIILGLMTDEHMNLGDATKRANKLVNTKSIEKKVDQLLNPAVTVMYKDGHKYNIPREEVEGARKEGLSNGR